LPVRVQQLHTRRHVLLAAPACSCGTTPLALLVPMVDVM
jgi:hypothetical protein